MSFHSELAYLRDRFGIILPPSVQGYTSDESKHSFSMAVDAQPALITVGNSGIPAYLTNFIDPEVIRVLTTPNQAADIYGETQKGSWTTKTATFVMVESTGETSAYGDYSNNGSTGMNVNFPQRQSFHYQTISQYGDKEVDTAAEARINYVSEIDIAAALILDKYQNLTYFYGVSGLQNYGALNDPSLPPSILPTTKAAGGTTWAVATADEIFSDIVKLMNDLISRNKGIIDINSPMTLAMSPSRQVWLSKTNSFGINVGDLIKKNYPKLEIKTAAQYDLSGGNSMLHLFAKTVDGKATSYCGFTEKMRAHGYVRDVSSTRQKKSQGTWGCIIRYPVAFSSMTGL